MLAANQDTAALRLGWEQELFAEHRWGNARHGEKAVTEHARLNAMWQVIPAHARPPDELLGQIMALEICNWNLESSVLALCRAIGANARVKFPIGHLGSCSEERWRKIWAYHLALRDWLPKGDPGGIGALLHLCDPEGTVAEHVRDMLGERTPLKELYVERFCLTLECWLRGQCELKTGHAVALPAAVKAIDEEILQHDPDPQLLRAMAANGALFPCHHKLFRRFAIILSSIGIGKWRGAMPVQGDGPAERATTVEKLVQPIDDWLHAAHNPPSTMVAHTLGGSNPTKRFLAALLISLLRSQKRVG